MWKIESWKRSPTNEERLGLPPVMSERKLISNVTFNLSFMINADLCTINLLIKCIYSCGSSSGCWCIAMRLVRSSNYSYYNFHRRSAFARNKTTKVLSMFSDTDRILYIGVPQLKLNFIQSFLSQVN